MTVNELLDEAHRCANAAGIYFEGVRKLADGVVVDLAAQPKGSPPRPGDAAYHWPLSADELRDLTPADVRRHVEQVARRFADLRHRPPGLEEEAL